MHYHSELHLVSLLGQSKWNIHHPGIYHAEKKRGVVSVSGSSLSLRPVRECVTIRHRPCSLLLTRTSNCGYPSALNSRVNSLTLSSEERSKGTSTSFPLIPVWASIFSIASFPLLADLHAKRTKKKKEKCERCETQSPVRLKRTSGSDTLVSLHASVAWTYR